VTQRGNNHQDVFFVDADRFIAKLETLPDRRRRALPCGRLWLTRGTEDMPQTRPQDSYLAPERQRMGVSAGTLGGRRGPMYSRATTRSSNQTLLTWPDGALVMYKRSQR